MIGYFSSLSQQVIAGLVVAAIVALVAAIPFARWLSRKRLPRAPEDRITILLAKIEGDASATTQQTLRECISKNLQNGVAIIALGESIRLGSGLHETAEAEALRGAHNLLKSKNADLLIWGRLKSPDVVSLRFTPAEQQYTQPQTYTLTHDSLELPTQFISHLGITIAAYATSALDRTSEQKPEMLPTLQTLGDRLENLIRNPNAEFGASTIATFYHCCARIKVRRYDLSGDDRDLRDSIIFNREALKRRDRVNQSADWAKTQNNLGSCLARLAERTAVLAYFDEAASALEGALEELQKDNGASIRVTATRMNLANILMKRGQRETTADSLKRSVLMLETLSTEKLRTDDAQLYAGIQNNRGLALMLLGEREADLANLNKALEILGEALEIRTEEIAPFDWACTKVNLAGTLVPLGERTGELVDFQSAIESLRDALRIIKRSQNPRLWAMAQNNLGIARIAVANEQNEPVLRYAISSLMGALEITRREDDPVLWTSGQLNLGRAQTQLGCITGDVELLKKALLPFRAVMEETSVHSSLMVKWHVSNEYGWPF
jgi:tetratricopeptide (TPR) repeat protein